MRWLVLFAIACGSPTSRGKPAAPDPTAAEIVAKLEAKYAAAKTYADHGTARNPSATLGFETTFVRGARFRFDVRNETDPQRGFVIWADPTHTYSRWYAPSRTTNDGPGLGLAIAVATKPSGGVIRLLGNLLEPTAVPRPKLAEPRITGTEVIDDRPCWVITGKRDDGETMLWIDRETFVLRRSAEDSDTATFAPVLDATIDIAGVPAPDFSDDYAEDSKQQTSLRAMVNMPAPAFDSVALDDKTRITLGGLAGNVVLVDFWATWCGPCRMTLPKLNEWHARYASRGLRIVGLSSEGRDEIATMVNDQKLAYLIGRDDNGVAARAYKASALPMMVVVDRVGVVRYVTLGAGNLEAVEAVIERLLR